MPPGQGFLMHLPVLPSEASLALSVVVSFFWLSCLYVVWFGGFMWFSLLFGLSLFLTVFHSIWSWLCAGNHAKLPARPQWAPPNPANPQLHQRWAPPLKSCTLYSTQFLVAHWWGPPWIQFVFWWLVILLTWKRNLFWAWQITVRILHWPLWLGLSFGRLTSPSEGQKVQLQAHARENQFSSMPRDLVPFKKPIVQPS